MRKYEELFTESMKEDRECYPLSQSQLGIYFACLENQGTDMYNLPYYFFLDKKKVDGMRLVNAISEALSAHELLRCRIEIKSGAPAMIIGNPDFNVPVIKIDSAELEEKLNDFIGTVDLSKNILFAAAVFETEDIYCPVFVFHHIVFDGSSFHVLIKEIEDVYQEGHIKETPTSTVRLGILDEKLEAEGEYDEGREFFRQRFDGNDAGSGLLPDVYEEGVKPHNGCQIIYSRVRGEADAQTGNSVVCGRMMESGDAISPAEVEAFNGGKGVGMFFIAAFAYTLAKFAGGDETVFCTVNHGRNDERLKNAVGMMVRTLPIYTKIDEKMKVKDFLASVKKEIRDTIIQGNYPFSKLSAEYGISVEASVVYQGENFNKLCLDGTEAYMNRLMPKDASLPIAVHIFKENDSYKLMIYYREDLYSPDYICSFADMYLHIVSEFMKREYLSEISLVSEKEMARLDRFNQTEAEYDKSKTVVDLFRQQVKQHPDNTAVVYADRRYTYRETDEISDRLAGYVRSLGIGREDVVSILIPRSEYMVLASLGVLKAGAAYQPLDPTYPQERLKFMIEDSSAKLLIADEELRALLPDYTGDVLLTKDIPGLPACEAQWEAPKPEDLLILLYTSGSTGVPKGVMLEHGNLAAFCHWYTHFYELQPESRVAAYASYGFDANMMDTYPALTTGAAVYIIAEEMRLDFIAMNGYFEENAITHSFMTTQVGRAFATEMKNTSLRYLSVGGEALAALAPPEGMEMYNVYGPTECTILTTSFQVDSQYKKIPIGSALDNVKLYVADSHGRRLPVGACGELYISGRQVARGYLNRPEQTEKAFTKNPFSTEKEYERIYHTGDVVRCLSDGVIDFVGRNDGQVKLRGFRIELTEIEGIIREFDGIRDATVVAFDHPGGGKYIAAYIVGEETVNIDALNEFIAENKPPYMVPSVTVQIDEIPLNVNGKVDKRKLPKAEPVSSEEEPECKPATVLEEKLSEIIGGILGHEPVSVAGNLLQDGLTSLSVIKLAVMLDREFGYEADVKSMMKGCSILSIENGIVEQWMNSRNMPQEKERGREEEIHREYYPLSKAQFGVYADCMKKPGTTSYNIPVVYTFPKTIGREMLVDGIKTVLSAHPYVFTHLAEHDGDIMQVYAENTDMDIMVIEMEEQQIEEFKKGYVQPFNLMKAPLIHMAVAETEKSLYLFADFHHIIFDGGSVNLFLEQLKTVLEGGTVTGEKFSCYDYIEEEEKILAGEAYKEAENYFAGMLADCEGASEIAPDLDGNFNDGSVQTVYAAVDHAAAERFCTANGVTPAQLYMAASCYALSRFVNSRHVYISTISNGRSNLKLKDTFGMFVKTIPVGTEVKDSTSLAFVKAVGEAFSGAVDHEFYPYGDICRKYNYAPDIMFEYQLGVVEEHSINGQAVGVEILRLAEAKFKVKIEVRNYGGKPCILVGYNDALYSRERMQTLAQSVAQALAGILAAPEQRIRKVSLLNEEQRMILDSFAATEKQAEEGALLMHASFERQAEINPEKCALIAADRTMTYRELDRTANIVANRLIDRGFGCGSRAVVLLRRTSKMLVAFLAVLKAGGAYIPTDMEYPSGRIRNIMEDSGADIIITEGSMVSEYEKAVDMDELLAGGNEKKPEVSISPEDTAYLIYTSGSTGKPKGVILRHLGVANYVTDTEANIHVHIPVSEGSVYGSVTTVAFDMAVKEIWVALSNGMTLAFADDVQSKDPTELAEFMKINEVDVFNATPSRLLQYMEMNAFVEALKKCRVILSGAEKYPEQLLRLLKKNTDARLLNTYGPTEITVSANAAELTDTDFVSVGRPLRGYVEYIVDSDDNLVPPGVMGELIIAGCGVAKGYNNLPEETEKAFIQFAGMRAYRSGDYAKWTDDGNVVIFGRKDNQIKLRGLRIELDEIGKRLSDIEGIKTAVAVIRRLGAADAICAYYTADREMDVEAIKEELGRSLTDYMIPTSYNQMDVMPLTVNGKINIKALPEPVAMGRSAGRSAATEIEKVFCEIFANVLQTDVVYADDNFFELGGSSLTVTRVIIAADKAGYKVAYADVFSHPTPETLAELVNSNEVVSEFENLGNYDYSEIHALLGKNTLEHFKDGEKQELGTVLLTGATGFLGIHVLYELLYHGRGNVYCLLRDKRKQTAVQRLNGLFFYYFDEVPSKVFGDRLTVKSGDITNAADLREMEDCGIDTVINCAANVKHFSKGADIEEVNYNGVLNILDFCKKTGSRLVQVSTNSIGGMVLQEGERLYENQLYIGQRQISKYTQSKFMAERAILAEAANGLNAKIMRVGNLSARDRDGEFQANFNTNSFIGRLKASYLIGAYRYEDNMKSFELSPIDYVAKAILLLAKTPKECTVFHPFNNNMQIMGNLYHAMNMILPREIQAAEADEYADAFDRAGQDERVAGVLSSMIAYQGSGREERLYAVGKENHYTMQVLYRMGFRWPVTSEEYMKRFLKALAEIGFFDL